MPQLDPAAAAILAKQRQAGAKPVEQMTPQEAREALRALAAANPYGEPVAERSDHQLAFEDRPIDFRLYRPVEEPGLPVLVWFHGGGWYRGDLETHDAMCSAIANRSGWAVVSVDYRLAPEHQFPAAVEDALDMTAFVAQAGEALGLDGTRLVVGGDSSGGNLAAVATQQLKGEVAIAGQVLLVPVTDGTISGQSYIENATGFGLTAATMSWYWDQYVPAGVDRNDPSLSPLLAADVSGLPPALIITAECDPLRDDGERYAEKLRSAGVKVEHTRYPGMVHNFVQLASHLEAGQRALDEMAEWLRRLG